MVGISAYGGYVPSYRLNRMAIFGAMGWMNPVLIAHATGEKAVANFDEDSITLATAAGINCMEGFERERLDGVYFASTTAPFRERQNAVIMAGALCAREDVRTADFAGSLRSGTSSLLSAIEAVGFSGGGPVLVSAADCRLGKSAAVQEMYFGDAAASMLVGSENVIAEFKGSCSLAEDFVDHVRGSNSRFDRQWEERWIRDLGYQKFIPEVVQRFCRKYGMTPQDFNKIIFPSYMPSARRQIIKMLGVDPAVEQDGLQAVVGDAGSAQPLLMLGMALEEAEPGNKILVVSYGNGCDALYFEVTEEIKKLKNRKRVSPSLALRQELDNYQKMLVWRDMLPADIGARGEEDQVMRWSLEWRHHNAVLGMQGSRCEVCGEQQFPPQRICGNPECGAIDQTTPVNFSLGGGTIFTYTSDLLAATVNPPSMYGSINFDGGGRAMMDFTDCKVDQLAVGKRVKFTFRIHFFDFRRDLPIYFWKAIPVEEEVS